jgi:mRNA-degrading endonuclease RelE of RelBE toxin-antitoxin system
LRIWKYRFLYEIIEDKILIYFYDADSRWDVYK